jgi:membrane protease YdiL (CAAX protease family)
LRKTWKEVGLALLNLAAVLAVMIVGTPLLGPRTIIGSMVGSAVLCSLTYLAAVKLVERRRLTEFALDRALPEFSAGFVGGFGLFAAVMALLWIVGAYHPEGWDTSAALGAGLALALAAGLLEEILFRGLLFRICSRIVGTWAALLLTAALFGGAHAINRGATVGSSVAIALEAGIMLGAAYAATGRLWLPIGLHAGWNFTEGSVFGTALSGYDFLGPGLVRGSLPGPAILTGGDFGPEASLTAVVVCLAAGAYLIRRTVVLQRVEPPIWRRTSLAAQPNI